MKSFIREQRHVCGPTIDDARYQEIDFFPVTSRQHKASTRGKKQLASSLVQMNLNEENAYRHFCQVAHTNFGIDDFALGLDFSDKYHPATEDEAWRIYERYVDRINYRRKKQGMPLLKYMAVLELQGKRKPRYHFHVIADGRMPAKELRSLWSDGRGKAREQMGRCRIDNLDFSGNGGTILGLCKYMMKDPEGKRRWRQSQGLKQPKRPRPNDGRYSRSKLAEMCKSRIDDHTWWRNQYPGWELVEPATAKYNDHTGWSMYAKLRRTDWARARPVRDVQRKKE